MIAPFCLQQNPQRLRRLVYGDGLRHMDRYSSNLSVGLFFRICNSDSYPYRNNCIANLHLDLFPAEIPSIHV